MEKYLKILEDSLKKKSEVLDRVMEISEVQEKCLTGDDLDVDGYNEATEEKGELVSKLEQLDDGFAALYDRVAPALHEDPKPHAEHIRRMQELIAEVSEKTALLQARDMRIQARLDHLIKLGAGSHAKKALPQDAARKYKSTMTGGGLPSSVFVDNKSGKKNSGTK